MTWITKSATTSLAVLDRQIACEKFHKLVRFAADEAPSQGRDMTEPGPSGSRPAARQATKPATGSEYAGAGLQFAFTLIVFVFIGIWLDKRLGSSPWFLLICVFVGAAGGFYSMYRKLMGSAKRASDGRVR